MLSVFRLPGNKLSKPSSSLISVTPPTSEATIPQTQRVPLQPFNSHHPGHSAQTRAAVSTLLADPLSSKPFIGHDSSPPECPATWLKKPLWAAPCDASQTQGRPGRCEEGGVQMSRSAPGLVSTNRALPSPTGFPLPLSLLPCSRQLAVALHLSRTPERIDRGEEEEREGEIQIQRMGRRREGNQVDILKKKREKKGGVR